MHCPYCKMSVDRLSNPNNGLMPKVGDVVLCTYCLSVSIYDRPLRMMSETEIVEMEKHPEFMKALQEEIDFIRAGILKPELSVYKEKTE